MAADDRVLAGLRVFELSVAVAAPCCGRYLAHHGAEVIKVESKTNPDVVRLFGSAWARDPELADVFADTGPYVPEMLSGKKSVVLELKDEAARDAALAVLADCDIFLSNYTAEALVRLGMTYDELRAHNEQLIYVMMPGFGADPDLPYYPFRAFGPNQAPLVGFDALTGYPDQEPAGIATVAPPDYVGGMHAMLAILAALEHRDETGEGSRVVVSQMETTVSLLGPFLLDEALTGRVPEPDGNRVPWAAPSGVYPCRGTDVHVAITVSTDDQWDALLGLIDEPTLAGPSLQELAGRRAKHDAIDEAITAWTATRSPAEAAQALQRAGVPAHEVLDHRGVLTDPQIRDRRFYDVIPSARFGRDLVSGHPIRLSDTPGRFDWAGPNLGQHTREVLSERAGLSDDAIDGMVAAAAAFEASNPDRVLERPFDRWYEVLGLVDDADGGEG